MPLVTGSVRTWQLQPLPPNERLLVRFVPSAATSAGTTVLPLREEAVEPPPDGSISVNLAQTTNTRNDVFFRVVLEWFVRDRLNEKWVTQGRSELPGELRVPAAGGDLAELLSIKPRPGSTLYGLGAPPSSLRGVQYVDITGPKLRFYAPKGTRV
ncbi:hypothetical protein AB0230_07135 [Microbacterium sp. NPDC089190]|uniref:hypothetical protein n=1 Tax=Microbacterium sp. NPDC089190 TaxID=3155063 RepID=UPI00344C30F9